MLVISFYTNYSNSLCKVNKIMTLLVVLGIWRQTAEQPVAWSVSIAVVSRISPLEGLCRTASNCINLHSWEYRSPQASVVRLLFKVEQWEHSSPTQCQTLFQTGNTGSNPILDSSREDAILECGIRTE